MSAAGGLPLPEEVRDPIRDTKTDGNPKQEGNFLSDDNTNAAARQSDPKSGIEDDPPADSNIDSEQQKIPVKGTSAGEEEVRSKTSLRRPGLVSALKLI